MKDPLLKAVYKELYGEIPNDSQGRLDYLLSHLKFSKRQKDHVFDRIRKIGAIKWRHMGFTFYIVPKATPRPRSSRLKDGRMLFYVKGANDHHQFLKYVTRNEDIEIIATPIKIVCRTFLPIPKSMSTVEQVCAEMGFVRPISKPDWDNLAKTYCDMLSGIIISDDRLIIEGTLKKYYSVKPRVEIDLYYMEEYDCDFNRKKYER